MEISWFSRFVNGFVLMVTLSADHSSGVDKLPALCSDRGKQPKCEIKTYAEKLICWRDYKSIYRMEYSNCKSFILCGWPDFYLDPEDILNSFPLLEKLIIKNGNVSQFVTKFPASDRLEYLTLRNVAIDSLPPNLFTSLINLKYLDLRNNRLTLLNPNVFPRPLNIRKIYLADNPWKCTSDLMWMVEEWAKGKLVNGNGLFCSDVIYPGKPLLTVMFLIKSMEDECPKELCSCSMENIVWDTSKNYLVPVITVNCSDKGLLRFPNKIPKNTTTLILKRNNITDLLPLTEDATYGSIADVYLDDNRVGNVAVLEGAQWLTRFRVLSLRGNILKQLPTYVFDNAFEKNTNMAAIYLGGNPWKCDCTFTSDFQHLLIKYRSIVKDKQEITCAELLAGDDSPLPVIEVSIGTVCAAETDEINPVDIVSVVLACMIILVLGKLGYDCWTFKRTGKLPWIVAKIP